MNNDDYKNKIDEHRKPINIEKESTSNSRVSRRSTKQPVEQLKPRRNLLLPILFAIFILIPVGFLIYIQVFYEPNQNETAIESDEFEYAENEQEPDTAGADVPSETTPDSVNEDAEPETVIPAEDEEEENSEGEVIQGEVEDEPVVEEPEEPVTSEKTHIVQPNETLYRIAMNYYNSPEAVEKIKEANGLTSDSISTGQTLILP